MPFELAAGGRKEGAELSAERRSLSLEDLQEASSGEPLDSSQWQRRTGLLPLSFQNPVYHMSTTSPRQQTDATPSDGSAGSQGNSEDRSTMATKPAFLTQMSVGLGGAERGERGVSALSSSSSGEDYSRRALSLSDTPGSTCTPTPPSHSGAELVIALRLPLPSGSSAPLRQNVSCPQRRIDQPPPPCSAPAGPPRGRTPPNIISGVGSSAYPPRPASGSLISSSPDWPNSSQSRLRQMSSSSKGDSPEKRPAAKVSRLAARRRAAPRCSARLPPLPPEEVWASTELPGPAPCAWGLVPAGAAVLLLPGLRTHVWGGGGLCWRLC